MLQNLLLLTMLVRVGGRGMTGTSADKARLVLPNELNLKIFSYLSPPEIGRLLLVCKVCAPLLMHTDPALLRTPVPVFDLLT
jgi:hypothetical protein